MKILTPEKRKALDEKRKRLHHTAAQFKTEFGELNAVIDRLTEIMGSWYLMPEFQKRPVTIHLWGKPGLGKTSLTNHFIDGIGQYQNHCYINLGEQSRHMFNEKLMSFLKLNSGKPTIVTVNNFQAVKYSNHEINQFKSLLRKIMNTSSFEGDSCVHYYREIFEFIQLLELLEEQGVQAQNGIVNENKSLYLNRIKELKGYEDIFFVEELTPSDAIPFVPDLLTHWLEDTAAEYYGTGFSLYNHFKTLNASESIHCLKNLFNYSLSKRRLVDTSKVLFLFIGNINWDTATKDSVEAFLKHEKFNPIELNLILFPEIKKGTQREIASRLLSRITKEVQAEYGITLTFDDRLIHKIISVCNNEDDGFNSSETPDHEDVTEFNTLESTIHSLIHARLGKIISEACFSKADITQINITASEKGITANYINDENGFVFGVGF